VQAGRVHMYGAELLSQMADTAFRAADDRSQHTVRLRCMHASSVTAIDVTVGQAASHRGGLPMSGRTPHAAGQW